MRLVKCAMVAGLLGFVDLGKVRGRFVNCFRKVPAESRELMDMLISYRGSRIWLSYNPGVPKREQ